MTDHREEETSTQPSQRSAAITLGLPAVGLAIIVGALLWGFQDSPTSTLTESKHDPVADLPSSQLQSPETVEPPVDAPETDFSPAPDIAENPELGVAALNLILTEQAASWSIEPLGTNFARQSNAVERAVAMLDNLRQGEVPYKLLPVARPKHAFGILDDGLAVTVNPSSFARYDGLAQTIGGINVEAIVSFYRQYQATLNAAWATLGYTDIALEDAVLSSLDIILLAPEISPSARLKKKEANWIYEDENLEALPSLQKQVIRMGPENMRIVQDTARSLRGAILDSAE